MSRITDDQIIAYNKNDNGFKYAVADSVVDAKVTILWVRILRRREYWSELKFKK